MIKISIQDEEIHFTTDSKLMDEKEMLEELQRIIDFLVAAYKYRIEQRNLRELTMLEEMVINQKVRDGLVLIPINEIREYIKEGAIDEYF